jgi:hypothetical protein
VFDPTTDIVSEGPGRLKEKGTIEIESDGATLPAEWGRKGLAERDAGKEGAIKFGSNAA